MMLDNRENTSMRDVNRGCRQMAVCITVSNHKGGVGKTTVSCNLGDGLARQGKRVLIIDTDAQCNATSLLLSPDIERVEYSLYDILSSDIDPYKCIYPTTSSNLMILPATEEISSLEPDLIAGAPKSLNILRSRLRKIIDRGFDYCIIDCPPNLGIFVLVSLHLADAVIVPVSMGSRWSQRGIQNVLDVIRSVKAAGNQKLYFLRILQNRYDSRKLAARQLEQQLRAGYTDDQIFSTTLPTSTVCEQAELVRKTVLQYNPASQIARSYRDLARETLTILGEHVPNGEAAHE